jgi:hypothetical protein
MLVWGGLPGEWEGQHPVSPVRAEHIPEVFFTGWADTTSCPPAWAVPMCSCPLRSGRPSARCSSKPWPADCRSNALAQVRARFTWQGAAHHVAELCDQVSTAAPPPREATPSSSCIQAPATSSYGNTRTESPPTAHASPTATETEQSRSVAGRPLDRAALTAEVQGADEFIIAKPETTMPIPTRDLIDRYPLGVAGDPSRGVRSLRPRSPG